MIYPDRADSTKGDYPEYEIRYKYTDDGRVSEVATVSSRSAADSEYGPEEYVVQYAYDDAGRLIRKVVIDNTADLSASTRYEAGYEFDGRGNMTREWILKYTSGTEERMTVLKDVRTTYDLGHNPTEIKVYSNSGPGGAAAAWAYTESRMYASGYQITGFSTNAAAAWTYLKTRT